MRCYVIENGIKEGIYFDKKQVENYTKNYSKRIVKKFASEEEANEYQISRASVIEKKKKKEKKNIYSIAVGENDYYITEVNNEMSFNSKKLGDNVSIKFFKGKDKLIKYTETFDISNLSKIKNENSYTIPASHTYKCLFDYSKETIETLGNERRYKKSLIAYTDGGFVESDDEYSSGIVLANCNQNEKITEKDIFKKISLRGKNPDIKKYRNVAGEIIAACYAIEYALKNSYKKLTIYHDYSGVEEFCTGHNCIKYIGFLYSNYYRYASTQLEINFVKVKAHSGNKLNNLADKLCK